MPLLTKHQKEALSSYYKLMVDYPDLFKLRNQRPIVRDPQILEAYAAEQNIVLGIAATTPYVHFVMDLVESKLENGTVCIHPYLRVISLGQLRGGANVVIVATIQDAALGELGDIVLLEQERHAIGSNEISLPRGFGESSLSGEENALKELREETGYIGKQAHLLGSTYTDSGLTDGKVFFYHIPVIARQSASNEIEEAIARVYLLSIDKIWNQINLGQIQDGFTLQALALYEKRQISGTS
jgi:ADP-ribose pyrophosphatase